MDKSEKYIEMCEKAKEIQVKRQIEIGNYYAYLRPMPGKSWSCITREEWLKKPYHPPLVDIIVPSEEDAHPIHVYTDAVEHCWLPRQDELQEMVKEEIYLKKSKFTLPQQLTQVLTIFAGSWARKTSGYISYSQVNDDLDKSYEDTKQFTSMEQLWLAFVMKEKYNKIWVKGEWRKNK